MSHDLLLDTHALIWLAEGDERVARLLPYLDDDGGTVSVSAVTWTEIAIKHSLGKLDVSVDITRALARSHGILDLSLTADHAEALEALPLHHADPFDRVLIAQAIAEGLTVATVDPAFSRYEGLSVIWP